MPSLLLYFPKGSLLTVLLWVWLEISVVPDSSLLFFLLGAIAVRLLSTVLKAQITGKKEQKILWRTTLSVGVYVCILATVWLAVNMAARAFQSSNYARILNITTAAITGVEVYLTMKNVYDIDPHGPLSKWVVRPIMLAVSGALERAAKYFKQYGNDTDSAESDSAPAHKEH